MASLSNAAQKLQEKLFASGTGETPATNGASDSGNLKINIPPPDKSVPAAFARRRRLDINSNANQKEIPAPIDAEAAPGFPNEADSAVEGLEDDLSEGKTYMQKLQEKLGDDYEGVELYRLKQDVARTKHWKVRKPINCAAEADPRLQRWGPYLSERQWATVREDYSANGDAWTHFPHEHARSRAYRWGEDGIAGMSDNRARICFSLALWNDQDRMLKERLFGYVCFMKAAAHKSPKLTL